MIDEWFKGLNKEDAERLQLTLKNSKVVLSRLNEVLEAKIRATSRVPANDYNNPSWAYKAADREGYIRALHDILLLTKENPISERTT